MKHLTLKALQKETSPKNEKNIESFSVGYIDPPFQITPQQFLQYAETDFARIYGHHLVNALSNVKRAIDSQVDALLYGFGLLNVAKEARWSFPKKIDQLKKIGLISPKILEKINRKRNMLEHEYKRPNKNDVENAIDVAKLFLVYTDRYLSRAVTECEIRVSNFDLVTVKLDYEKQRLLFLTPRGETRAPKKIEKVVSSRETDYLDYLSWYITLHGYT